MFECDFSETVFLWQGKAAWHFIPVPQDLSEDIQEMFGRERSGWGSVKVTARIGATTWQTSIFPDSTRGSYLLPLKKAVRTAESIVAGDTVHVTLDL